MTSTGEIRPPRLWDIGDLRSLGNCRPRSGSDPLTHGVFSPDNRTLAAVHRTDRTVWLIDIGDIGDIEDVDGTGRPAKAARLRASGSWLYPPAFSADGRRLAAGAADGQVLLWDVHGTAAPAVLAGRADPVPAVAFGPHGDTLATGGNDFTIRLCGHPPGPGRRPRLRQRVPADHPGRVGTVLPGGRLHPALPRPMTSGRPAEHTRARSPLRLIGSSPPPARNVDQHEDPHRCQTWRGHRRHLARRRAAGDAAVGAVPLDVHLGRERAAVEGFFDGGADRVLVNEAHWTMRNLLLERLDERVEMLTGRHKALSMVEGVQHGDVDGIAFVGYHAGAGMEGVLAHTYLANQITGVWLNGVRASEGLLNAHVVAEYGVPVVLVTGDDIACEDALGYAPEVRKVAVKDHVSRYAAVCRTPARTAADIRAAAKEATGLAVRHPRCVAGRSPSPSSSTPSTSRRPPRSSPAWRGPGSGRWRTPAPPCTRGSGRSRRVTHDRLRRGGAVWLTSGPMSWPWPRSWSSPRV